MKLATLKQLNNAISKGNVWEVEKIAQELKNKGVKLDMAIAVAIAYQENNGDDGKKIFEIMQIVVNG